MEQPKTPCILCNDHHRGVVVSTPERPTYKDHAHEDREGVGNIRLLVIGNGKIEFCWRCGCRKSGWVNVPNTVAPSCTDPRGCVCHTEERAY